MDSDQNESVENNQTRCPLCDRGTVAPKPDSPHKGLPHCDRCGAVEIKPGSWVYECAKCSAHVMELHGIPVPHLCSLCWATLLYKQRQRGQVCGLCRQPRAACCC
jgi:hypothetical protein